MKKTKAERIFRATRWECKKHYEAFGYEVNPNGKAVGFNGLITEEHVCTRTFNDIQKIINNRRKDLELYIEHELIGPNYYKKETEILNMVQSTLDNAKVYYALL